MKQHFNLMPTGFRRRLAGRHRLVGWGAVWLATCAGGAAFCLMEGRLGRQLRRERAAIERRATPLRELQVEIDRLRDELQEIDADEQSLAELIEDRPVARLMSLVSRGVQQCERRVRLDSLDLAAARTADNEAHRRAVRLEGDAESHVAVMQFLSALRDTKAFTGVEILSTSQRKEQHHSFQLECTF